MSAVIITDAVVVAASLRTELLLSPTVSTRLDAVVQDPQATRAAITNKLASCHVSRMRVLSGKPWR